MAAWITRNRIRRYDGNVFTIRTLRIRVQMLVESMWHGIRCEWSQRKIRRAVSFPTEHLPCSVFVWYRPRFECQNYYQNDLRFYFYGTGAVDSHSLAMCRNSSRPSDLSQKLDGLYMSATNIFANRCHSISTSTARISLSSLKLGPSFMGMGFGNGLNGGKAGN